MINNKFLNKKLKTIINVIYCITGTQLLITKWCK